MDLPSLIIDSPLTPMSTVAEVDAWIARLHALQLEHAGDLGAMAQLRHELQRATDQRRAVVARERGQS